MRERFTELLCSVKREGIEELIMWLEGTDFYTAPASTRFHLACEGGLLQHSLNVYQCLKQKQTAPLWKEVLAEVAEESIILVALLHDICKANCYSVGFRNVKTYEKADVDAAAKWQIKTDENGPFVWKSVPSYEFRDGYNLGHGEKSLFLASKFIRLTDEEAFAIRWHMGFADDNSHWSAIGDAFEKYPLALALYEADLEASKILEKNA